MIELVAGRARARVDPSCGGRITDLVVDSTSLLVTGDPRHDDPLDWGLYPMVPFAGRLRDGELRWRGETYHFPLRRPPHAIHGTVLDVEWNVVSHTPTSCTLSTPLIAPWPFPGRVDHEITLAETGLDLRLTVHATVDMPVQIGWHPWFRKATRVSFPFRAIHRRDASGVAEPTSTPLDTSHWNRNRWAEVDDCFTGLDDLLTLEIDGLVVDLSSTCEHWVVFDRPSQATCVEPQSGPPDVLTVDPVVVAAGTSRDETFRIAWADEVTGTENGRVSVRSRSLGSLDHREGRRP